MAVVKGWDEIPEKVPILQNNENYSGIRHVKSDQKDDAALLLYN